MARAHWPIVAGGLAAWRAPIGRFWSGGRVVRAHRPILAGAGWVARAHRPIEAGGLGGWRATIGRD